MDPALLRDRQAFMKKASTTLSVEKRKQPVSSHQDSPAPSSSKRPAPSSSNFDYKTAQLYPPGGGPNHRKFGTLSSIIRYMKNRHLEGDTHALSLEEIFDEANLSNVPPYIQAWLENEALPQNKKIETKMEGSVIKFLFKPTFNIRSRKDIIQLLKTRYRNGEGGVLKEELEECVPNLDKLLQLLSESVIQITRPTDKKVIVYYNDKSVNMIVDEVAVHLTKLIYCNASILPSKDFKKYWRSISVEKMTDQAIEQSLEKSGISSQAGEKKVFISAKSQKKPSSARRRGKVKLRDNAHLETMLHDFAPV